MILLPIQQPGFAKDLPTGEEIRDLMLRNWEKVEDYEVDIQLAVNIPGFRMPSRKIHYLYKAPDKSKVEVKGFAVVPKQGIQPFITFLKDSIELEVLKDSTYLNHAVFEISLADTFMNRVGSLRLLVDQENGSVYKVQVRNDDRIFFEMHSTYTEEDGIFLPESSDITMHFPPDFKNIQRLGKKPTDMAAFDASMTDEWLEGTIRIEFKKYKVNRGLPDYLFEQDEADIIQD
jgi:hypothetical protein